MNVFTYHYDYYYLFIFIIYYYDYDYYVIYQARSRNVPYSQVL
jgi:hypothetical protein